MTYVKTILQVSFRCFTRPLFLRRKLIVKPRQQKLFCWTGKSHSPVPSSSKTVLRRETSRLSRDGSAALFYSCGVQTFILQVRGHAAVCAVESLVVEVHDSASAGEEPAPRMLEGEDCTPSYFFCAWVFVPFAPWLGFIGKRSVRSRLRCLFCFSANNFSLKNMALPLCSLPGTKLNG